MPRITFITHDENTFTVDVESGTSLMQAAVNNDIEGIVGECGGLCSCATCHCYIDPAWTAKTGDADDMERDMLECALEPAENSRLGCQVEVSDDLDGLVVRLPEAQM